jgi:hypothetical protein
MSSFFKKLLGGGSPEPARKVHEPESYKDCTITPTPMKEGAQWRLAGAITKMVDGETYERTFIRADLFASEEEAKNFTVRKAQQIIDQNGDSLFRGERTGTA